MAGAGSACLLVGVLTAAYAAGASLYGARSGRREFVVSGRRAIYCLAALAVAATVVLQVAFLRSDFSYKLVAEGSSTDTPTFYKVTAMWATQDGSLLLWALLLSLFSSAVLFLTRRSLREIAPYATAVLGVVAGFFCLLMVGWENPFGTLANPPAEGSGLNPLLRHPAMMIHPPMLYTGYVGFAIRDRDGATSVPVVYEGVVPDPFREGREVIVSGELEHGTFVAQRDSLVTKCPSKFTKEKEKSS